MRITLKTNQKLNRKQLIHAHSHHVFTQAYEQACVRSQHIDGLLWRLSQDDVGLFGVLYRPELLDPLPLAIVVVHLEVRLNHHRQICVVLLQDVLLVLRQFYRYDVAEMGARVVSAARHEPKNQSLLGARHLVRCSEHVLRLQHLLSLQIVFVHKIQELKTEFSKNGHKLNRYANKKQVSIKTGTNSTEISAH